MILAKTHTLNKSKEARSLSGLMDLYESNYIRLRKLIPDLDAVTGPCESRVSGALSLHLRLLERSPYTTTLKLTYLFTNDEEVIPAPDVTVRIYHDARLAEVLACGHRRGLRAAEYDRMRNRYPLLRKWEINRFFQKWVGYCLHQQHSFAPDHLSLTD